MSSLYNRSALVYLVGSKADLGGKVSKNDVKSLLKLFKSCRVVEVSAKTGGNVQYLFEMVAEDVSRVFEQQ